MTKKKNSEQLISIESISLNISLDKFKHFLKYLLQTLADKNKKITRESFYKLFPKFPYFAKKKLFDFFIEKRKKEDMTLTPKELIENIIKILYGTFEEKIELFANFFNFNKDNLIHYEDIRLFFYHFFLFSYQNNFESLDRLLEFIFQENNKITIPQFIKLIKYENSDLFFLFYFSLNKFFFGKTDMEFFNKNLGLKIKENKSENSDNEIIENIIQPTKEIFNYINDNYGLNLEYNEEEEDYDELESLKNFEDDVKRCRETITTNYSENDNSYEIHFQRKISCNLDTFLKKKLVHRISTEFNLSDNEINKLFIYQKSENIPSSPKRSSLFSFDQITLKEDFNNVIMIINDKKIPNCELKFSDNYLLVNYIINSKQKYLIIPLAYSFPNKNIKSENSVFESGIISQIFENEISFIFQFPSNSKRNIFYNELKRLTNFIDIKEKYNLIGQIGKGAFGDTYLATKAFNKLNSIIIYDQNENIKSEKYAIKVINKSKMKKKDPELLINRNEIEISKILQEVNHPNIIKMYDVLEDIDNIYLVMEYCPINKEELILNLEKKYNLIKQIINGIQFLHGIGIIHRDIKPENILLGSDNNYKIIDFGFADLLSPFETQNEPLGSYCYFPPEMLLGNKYPLKVEYWNIGIITFYYLFNFFPFGQSDNVLEIQNFNICKFIKQQNLDNVNGKYSIFIQKMKDIIITCLNLDINKRGYNLNNILQE